MKRADVIQAWRKVGKDWDGQPLTQLSVHSLPGFTQSITPLSGGLAIYCGVNASGKTRLLHAVLDCVRMGDTSQVSLTPNLDARETAYIDTFWLLQKQRLSLGRDGAIEDRVEQAGLVPLRAHEQRMASYLLGRDYGSIELAELDATDDDDILLELAPNDPVIQRALDFRRDVVPYFKVTREGASYSSAELSQGELAGLTLLWGLRSLNPDTSVFLDEPETFLSPQASQRALDVIAHFAGQRRSYCHVSSHSYLGLAAAPAQHVQLLRPAPQNQGLVQVGVSDERSLWSTLRLSPPKVIVFVVEDAAASQWLKYLLSEVEFALLEVSEVWVAGDSGQVRRAAKFPKAAQGATIAIWGVLDGDERARGGGEQLIFLPGEDSPETIMIRALESDSIALGGISNARVMACLARHEGDDPHDRIALLASDLGMPVTALRHEVLRAWLASTEDGRTAMLNFKRDLLEVAPPALRS